MQSINRTAKTLVALSVFLFTASSMASSIPVPSGNGDGLYPKPRPKVVEVLDASPIAAVEIQ